jgi:hypothetical protein
MNRLLDQTINDRRNPQHARAPTGLGYVHSPHWLGLIYPVEDLLFQSCPVLQQVIAQLAHFPVIHSGGTSVGDHGLHGPEHVPSLEHSFDEVWFSGAGLLLASRKV